ncbi:hypothetical protein NA57DRAFT_59051 [Rhizodiscina lignyota]|uniref:NACHT domain-containing protein n=1 Tax=Rhizodiscina lignyota TaxID=1504668 RepID=A0A9P4I6P4_9PEZI|nr:hypothetical protein NA57DRAFT_59051 [Rhizodiscina lignyota]
MAEAISAFGLAASILQVIDFSSNVVAKFWKFYRTTSDRSNECPDINSINSDLCRIVKDLQSSSDTSNNDAPLWKLARECQTAAEELQKILQSLLVAHSTTTSRKWNALKAAFRAVWKDEEIQSLRDRLERFKSQLILNLLCSIRESAQSSVEQQKELLQQMKAIQLNTDQIGSSVECLNTELLDSDGLGSLLLDFVTAKVASPNRRETNQWLRSEVVAAICRDSQDAAVVEHSSPSIPSWRENRLKDLFLTQLRYTLMEDREERIAEAYGNTFRWVFEDTTGDRQKWSNFKDWLAQGSGKSTLIKYICHEDTEMELTGEDSCAVLPMRCSRYLRQWARNCRLITAKFFFWNSGTALRMTQAGLFRTILAQILDQAPDVTAMAMPKRWEALCLFGEHTTLNHDWTEQELRNSLLSVTRALQHDTRLCLFVDGLDEFDGNHNSLISLFKEICATSSVKLCVASRPWVIFEDGFKHKPSLRLQDLTYPDIKLYISSHFIDDEGFALLLQRERAYAEQLIENIIEKAAGVFLWVTLVVTSLLRGMGHGDRISDLQTRLDALPPELEQLYDKMLYSLDPFYLEHAAQYFQLIRTTLHPLKVLSLGYADEEHSWSAAIMRPVSPITTSEATLLHETMRRRINSRCKGLLEISAAEKYIFQGLKRQDGTVSTEDNQELQHCTVQYLHRTVKDYIESDGAQKMLNSAIKSPYDPHLHLCASTLATLKTDQPITILDVHAGRFWGYVEEFLYHASRILPTNSLQMVEMMDDLNGTCACLARRKADEPSIVAYRDCKLLESGQWLALQHEGTLLGASSAHFLSLAVCYGIVGYVERRASKGCLVQTIEFRDTSKDSLSDGGVRNKNTPALVKAKINLHGRSELGELHHVHSLLLDAINRPTWKERLIVPTWKEHLTVPDPVMVACLLRKGANPNFPFLSGTVWDAVLRAVRAAIPYGLIHDTKLTWLQIVKMLLEFGAGEFVKFQRSKLLLDLEKVIQSAHLSARGLPLDFSGHWTSFCRDVGINKWPAPNQPYSITISTRGTVEAW